MTNITRKGFNGYYSYKGSLTYPPCSEIVNWYVYTEVFNITQSLENEFL